MLKKLVIVKNIYIYFALWTALKYYIMIYIIKNPLKKMQL